MSSPQSPRLGFRHAPLQSPSDEIRLLHIQPTPALDTHPSEAEIVCTLSHVRLNDNPEYIALSYVWGTQPPQCKITVNGLPFVVNPNLYSALRNLRTEAEIVLWIDAICINQKDNSEKSEQIQLMRDIYHRATHVLVWLGPSTLETDTAMYWIEKLGEELKAKRIEDIRHENVADWEEIADDDHGDLHGQTRQEIKRYFIQFITWLQKGKVPLFWRNAELGARPWFTRAWCLQECANGKEVVFQCGTAKVLLANFWTTAVFTNLFVQWAVRNYHTGFEAVDERTRNMLDGIDTMMPTFTIGLRRLTIGPSDDERLSLKRLLCRVNVLKVKETRIEATLPIDRVYSLLGIANDDAARAIKPDYGAEGEEHEQCAFAYVQVAKELLRCGHLDVLSLCRKRVIKRADLLPSWTPDWEAKNREPWTGYTDHQIFCASGSSTAFLSFDGGSNGREPEEMSIKGVQIETVEEVGCPWTVNLLHEELTGPNCVKVVQYLSEISEFVACSTRYNEEQKGEAVWRIPICDLEQGSLSHILRRATFHSMAGYTALKTLVNHEPGWYDAHPECRPGLNSYIGRLRNTHASRPFAGKDGFVGLCPSEARVGDVVVVFLGAQVPYVLRKVEDEAWELVGECFVFGAMDGEVMELGKSCETFRLR